MRNATKLIALVGTAVLVIFLVLAVRGLARRPATLVTMSNLGSSTSSNMLWITVGITNRSTDAIVYSVGSAQSQSNGMWTALNDFRFPAGSRLERLPAGTGTEVVVMAPVVRGEVRIPVLWGHSYTWGVSRWQQIREDAIAWYRMRDFRGRGALYTNHVTGIVR